MKIARTRVPKQCEFDAMLGANLQYMRKFNQLSMKKVAVQIPFTFQQLQKYEKGMNTISVYKLLQLCNIYKVTIAEIVKETFIENHQAMIDRYLDHADFATGKTPQDAGYLKPQKDIGSMEEISESLMDSTFNKLGKEFTMPDGKTVFFPEGITETALVKFKEQYMKKVHDH